MNSSALLGLGKKVLGKAVQESPLIFTIIGVVGVPTTTILGIKATRPALMLIEEAQKLKEVEAGCLDVKLNKKEVIAATWKLYLPTIGSGLLTMGSIVAAHKIHTSRHALLGAAYGLAQKALVEYQEKVVEIIGEKKEQGIRDEIAQDRLNKSPIEDRTVIISCGGQHLFYDKLSDRYFHSDIESVKRQLNDFNLQLMSDMSMSINELYIEMGLPAVDGFKNLGWFVEQGKLITPVISAKVATNGEPCLVLDFSPQPRYIDGFH